MSETDDLKKLRRALQQAYMERDVMLEEILKAKERAFDTSNEEEALVNLTAGIRRAEELLNRTN